MANQSEKGFLNDLLRYDKVKGMLNICVAIGERVVHVHAVDTPRSRELDLLIKYCNYYGKNLSFLSIVCCSYEVFVVDGVILCLSTQIEFVFTLKSLWI